MNCVRCNAPLEANTRFCRNCGLPVAASQPHAAIRLPPPPPQETSENTIRVSPSPLNSYQVSDPNRGAHVPPAAVTQPPRRRRGSCILGCLTTLVILLLALGLVWVFALRPYLHNIANTQIDHAMSAAVNQIPNGTSRLPAGPLPVKEDTLNNLLVLNIAPSDPVQKTNMSITRNGVRLDFQLYGQPCTITSVPQVQNGNLVASNVTVSGIIGLIMSPDEITSLLNTHLADAQRRINRSISSVRLMDHEMDLVLG